jgi:predicted phosphodiesterase
MTDKLIFPPGTKVPNVKAPTYATKKYPTPIRLICDSDLHYPIHDPAVTRAKFKFAKVFKPDAWINAGDCYDLYSVSSFAKEGVRMHQLGATLQQEFDSANSYWKQVCDIAENVHFILGNHEGRLMRLIDANQGLFKLKALEWHTMAGIPEKVQIHKEGSIVNIGGISFMHGDQIGGRFGVKNPTVWAAENFAESCIFGHFHSLATTYKTIRRDGRLKNIVCHMQGHGSITSKQTYAKNPSWTHSFTAIEFYEVGGKPRFTIHPIPIVEGRFMFGGQLFDGNK